jgi:UDP-perosamine 4-acetyltransferase
MDHDKTSVYCLILGGGGHARVLIDSLRGSGFTESCAILDSDSSLWGKDLLGVSILGDDNLLPQFVLGGASCFVVGLGSSGNNRPRQRLFELGLSHNLKPLIVIHPAAVCSPWATIGSGSQLLPASIVNAGATVGENAIVNSGAIVEHDCWLGDHAHVATGATLASTVRVGTGAHIGAGATVRQGLNIGEWAIVGAGAVVVKDVPPRAVVVGVPARPLSKENAPADDQTENRS